MTENLWTAEGGTDGTTVTPGNSGGASGNAIATAGIGASTACVYSTAAAFHGSLGFRITRLAASAPTMYLQRQIAAGAGARGRTHVYLNIVTAPGVDQVILKFLDGSAAAGSMLRLDATLHLVGILTAGGVAAGGTFTSAFSLATWYRVEFAASPGGGPTTGTMDFASYIGDGTTPIEEKNLSGLNLGSQSDVGYTRVGLQNTGGATLGDIKFDDWDSDTGASGYISVPAVAVSTSGPTAVPTNVGPFANVGGAGSLQAALSDASDATFIESQNNPVANIEIEDFPLMSSGAATVQTRCAATTTSPPITMTVELIQGPLPGTVIKTDSFVLTTTITDKTMTTTGPETANITDRSQLKVRRTVNA